VKSKTKKNEQSTNELWNNFIWPNMCVTWGRWQRGGNRKKIFGEIVAKKFPNLPLSLQIQKAQSMEFSRSVTWTSLRNLLEIQILGIHPTFTKSENLGVEPRNMCFNKPSLWCWHVLEFKSHFIRLRFISERIFKYKKCETLPEVVRILLCSKF